jgi:hypothetical protein
VSRPQNLWEHPPAKILQWCDMLSRMMKTLLLLFVLAAGSVLLLNADDPPPQLNCPGDVGCPGGGPPPPPSSGDCPATDSAGNPNPPCMILGLRG